ncbi:hypothetical protein [Aeromicrobium yanjiei]|uniref:Uncharacterized protein n=1 Tax=Aeromicrobium yanjiei TaxID=2662028 RepID=A0A5Q2M9U6_9ACTN|nr:hypothetical protein [Aeromicrobium yanjiei]QGG39894.1 hypothetical protein GEV26_00045 [Aeromicrobium yanjiei]
MNRSPDGGDVRGPAKRAGSSLAVVLDVAGISTANSNVSVYPSGGSNAAAFLKTTAGTHASSNTVVVKPGADGKVTFRNSAGDTDINVDVQGFFTAVTDASAAGGFVPVDPFRLVSTEDGIGVPAVKLVGGTTTHVKVGGVGDIPADASAIFANVRVTYVSSDGGLKVQASDASSNTATAINLAPGAPQDTGLSVKLGSDGRIKLTMSGSSSLTAEVKIDVQGYFSKTGGEGSLFNPLAKHPRIYDSRTSTAIPAKSSRVVKIAGVGGLPDDGSLSAVALTITAVDWTASGAVRVVNDDLDGGGTSNIGFWTTSDRSVVSTSIVSVSYSGEVRIDNTSGGSVHIILDAQGWFRPLNPVPPTDSDVYAFGDLGPNVEVGDALTSSDLNALGVDPSELTDENTVSTLDPEVPIEGSTEEATDGESETLEPGGPEADPDAVDPAYPDEQQEDPSSVEGPEILTDPVSPLSRTTGTQSSSAVSNTVRESYDILRLYHRKKSPKAGYYVIRRGITYPFTGPDGRPHSPYGWRKSYVKHNATLKMAKRTLKAGWWIASENRYEVIAYKWRCQAKFICWVKDAERIRVVYSNTISPRETGDYYAKGLISTYCPDAPGYWCPDWVKKGARKY